jgi:putative aminopeptidase FrvX
MKSIRLLEKLSLAFGPSGYEYEVAEIMKKEVKEKAVSAKDGLGSLIFEKKGTAANPRVMVAAHLDEVGFIIQNIAKKGFLRFHPIGGWDSVILPGQRLLIRGKKGDIEGVVGSIPPHFTKGKEKNVVPEIKDMLIDIGAGSEKEAQELGVEIGSFAIPSPYFKKMNHPGLFIGKAFDNRIGCSLIVDFLSLMEKEKHPNTVFAAATVQEEVGLRGARTAAESVKPDVALVLEAPPADDFPGITRDKPQGALGKGVQIRCFDPTMIGNVKLKDFVVDTAEKNSIPYQLAVRTGGGTDAGAIHLSGKGVPSIVLGVPVRYIHAPSGIMSSKDYESALKLLEKLVQSLSKEKVAGF